MTAVSSTPPERARKSMQVVLQRLQGAETAASLAVAMGVSEATISRIKNDRMEECLTLLAHLGLKVVPTDFKCVDRSAYEFLTRTHERIMARAPELIWEIEE